MKKNNIIIICIITMLGITGCVNTSPKEIKLTNNDQNNIITVTSDKKVKIVPDKAEINFSIYNESEDINICKKENNEKTNNVLAYIKSLNIDEKNIKVSNYSLYPMYDWIENNKTLKGYSINTSINLTNLSFEQLSLILDKGIDNGINIVNNVEYYSSEYDSKYNEALDLAIKQARDKADIIANASNSKIDKVFNVTENYYNNNTFINYDLNRSKLADSNVNLEQTAMNVEPGEIEINANVTVQYLIN